MQSLFILFLCFSFSFISGYQTAFSQLSFASKKDADPFSEIVCPKEYLAKQLYRLSVSQPGKVYSLL